MTETQLTVPVFFPDGSTRPIPAHYETVEVFFFDPERSAPPVTLLTPNKTEGYLFSQSNRGWYAFKDYGENS
jgi:hypothetical protein